MPRLRASSWKVTAENMLPCSVTATRRHLQLGRPVEQLADAAGAVEQRELRVQVKVDELAHPPTPTRSWPAASS